MARVIFTISYEIQPEKREEYLTLSQEMKAHLEGEKGKRYAVYEQKGRKNTFAEVFLCESMEEFDRLEDDHDEVTEQLVTRLEGMLLGKKMKYTTLVEVG